MASPQLLDENWNTLLSLFPTGWLEMGRKTKATERLRGFAGEEALLRVVLMHVAMGYSLRETVVLAKRSGLAEVSDVSLLKRLRKCEPWLKELALELMREEGLVGELPDQSLSPELVDATIVKEPGRTGSQWRIHYSLSLPSLSCGHFELTPANGSGNGESLTRFPIERGSCIIADRAYSRPSDVAHVHAAGGFVIVRLSWKNLPLYERSGGGFDLLSAMEGLGEEGSAGEWDVEAEGPSCPERFAGRVCAVRRSRQSAEMAIKKLKREASKKQTELNPLSLDFAKYVMVFTTLPRGRLSAEMTMAWYRVRWQVELLFKRFKSVAGLGHLPKRSQSSSRAWLYGKLFVCLVSEKLVRHASEVSPWGYPLGAKQSGEKQVEGVFVLPAPGAAGHPAARSPR